MKYSILEDPRYSHLAKPKTPLLKFFSFLFDLYANTVLTFYTPVTIVGKENIPKNEPFIFASNHNRIGRLMLDISVDIFYFVFTVILSLGGHFLSHRSKNIPNSAI